MNQVNEERIAAERRKVFVRLPLLISGADAIAYHLEQGEDNGGISRESLAAALRGFARAFTVLSAVPEYEHDEQDDRCSECGNTPETGACFYCKMD